MEAAMDDMMELWHPACTFIPNSVIQNDCGFNFCSSYACGDDGFFDQILVESMLSDADFAVAGNLSCTSTFQDWSTTISPCTTSSAGSPVDESHEALQPAVAVFNGGGADARELRVLHLLMAAAEAISGFSKSRYLARVILARLRELEAVASKAAFYRLAAHFTDALNGIIEGGGYRGCGGDVLEAFQLLQDMSPYVKFGHFTANQAILEALAGEQRVHIVDYDVMEGVQWVALMQAFVSKDDGLPPPRVRITAVTGAAASARRSAATVQDTGRRLAAFATSVGLQFSFGQCRLNDGEEFRPEAVKLVKGEAVVLNCVLHPPHLPHRNAASVASFLSGAAALGARVVTLVEEEGTSAGNFLEEFMDEMQRYSAIFDSLEAGYPMQERARGVVESVILGPQIAGAVDRAYKRWEGKGTALVERWAGRLETAGFGRVALSFFNLSQARLLIGLFNDGYRIEEESNKLVLCWKSCRLFSASVWSAPAAKPSPALLPGSIIWLRDFSETNLPSIRDDCYPM